MAVPVAAGRIFQFSERIERSLVDRMKDLDEIQAAVTDLYPGHTWTRSELLLLFFLDDAGDSLSRLVELTES
jgi:hypothetical protein